MDPIEYGGLLQLVKSIDKRMEGWPQLEIGLQKANQDIMFLKHSHAETNKKLDELIANVKHLNGCDEKLRKLGFRLDEAEQHRADLAHLRQSRIAAESRSGVATKVKTSLITALALSGSVWILSTLWAASGAKLPG